MKKLLLLTVMLFAVAPDMVGAADLKNPPPYQVQLPQAAPALAPVGTHKGIYPFTGTGPYWGLAFGGNTSNISTPTGAESLGLGSAFGVGAGYRWADSPTVAWAIDGQVMWNAISSTTGNAGPVDNDFTALIRAKAIIPLSSLTGVLPGPTPPLPPIPVPGFTAGQNTYAFVGYKIDHNNITLPAWTGRPGFGVGTENQASNGLVLDIWAGYFMPSNAGTDPTGTPVNNGHQYMVGANLWF